MKKLKFFIVSFALSIGTWWGLLEGYSYFQEDALRGIVGKNWYWLIYGIPLIFAIWATIQSKSIEPPMPNTNEPISNTSKRTNKGKNQIDIKINKAIEFTTASIWALITIGVFTLLLFGTLCLFGMKMQTDALQAVHSLEIEEKQISTHLSVVNSSIEKSAFSQVVPTPQPTEESNQWMNRFAIDISTNVLFGLLCMALALYFNRLTRVVRVAWTRLYSTILFENEPLNERVQLGIFALVFSNVVAIFSMLFFIVGVDLIFFDGNVVVRLITKYL